jgi:hypothetical protein
VELTHLQIEPKRWTGTSLEPSTIEAFKVPFNPTSYSIVKPVTWQSQTAAETGSSGGSASRSTRELDAPPLEFGGGGSRTLTLQLFFDVTEGGEDGTIRDVRMQTNKLVALSRIERDQQRPPVCDISWGEEPATPASAPARADFPFRGVVTNLTQNFVLFRSTGEPVRANLTVVFTEFIVPEENRRANDPDLTTHLLKRGDTLSALAARWYADPSRWRPIAEANSIDDPRDLDALIGKRLVIPRLR